MVRDERNCKRGQTIQTNTDMFTLPVNAHDMSSEEDLLVDVDEPPDLERTPRPSTLRLADSSRDFFSKSSLRCERKASLLTSALHSNNTSPVEESASPRDPIRGMSCTSTWSNNSSMSTAELTSDGGFTSSGTRTPSPPPPASSFHNMGPAFTLKSTAQPVAILHHDDDSIDPLQKLDTTQTAGENVVEATLGRKRCISFACGAKSEKKAEPEQPKPAVPSEQMAEPPKRACTIKFACPTKISTDAPSKDNKPRRAASPAPPPAARRSRGPPRSPKAHRGSDSTVRNASPVALRKSPAANRQRRLSANSDLARCEAFRFHEFASSEEEVEEWTLESTCHRRPLTINDTLRVENGLRQLGEEAEEEALDDEEEEDEQMDEVDDDEVELDEDEDDLDEDDSDAPEDLSSDEGFQTDDEGGFAGSDDESDAGSDYNWWTPGHSTAATSFEHLDMIRSNSRRSISESSIGSLDSSHHYKPGKTVKRRKSRLVNIRIPSPELPDSTDFVCGTLDEDRPLEDAYLSALERRRAAKHKKTPQDVDPTFPTSDPEMDEEDEDEEDGNNRASESDHFMMHGQMDPPNGDLRGRRRSGATKRSPVQSPKRLRSPPPPAKRTAHRSPPPHRKLFGTSPRPLRSPPAPARLRPCTPTRRGSSSILSLKRPGMSIHFAGLAGRPTPTTSTSLPRTPITNRPPSYDMEDDEDTPNEFPVRRAIDIKVGLERKRQRRKEQLYKKKHCKNVKEKRPPPGKGAERMREVGLGLAAHRGKNAAGFAFHAQPTPDKNDIHVLSV